MMSSKPAASMRSASLPLTSKRDEESTFASLRQDPSELASETLPAGARIAPFEELIGGTEVFAEADFRDRVDVLDAVLVEPLQHVVDGEGVFVRVAILIHEPDLLLLRAHRFAPHV